MKRFWSKVDKDGPIPAHKPELGQCWVWTASKNNAGYGRFGFQIPEMTDNQVYDFLVVRVYPILVGK